MSDYEVDFEVHSGQFMRTRVAFDDCSYTISSEPSEAQLQLEKIHFSSIKEIESLSTALLKLTTCDNKVKTFRAIGGSTQDIMQLVKGAVVALASVYPMVPIERLFTSLNIHPAERLKNLHDEHSAAVRETNYAADENQDAGKITVIERTFSLSDFRMRCSAENGELLSALQHNTWFIYFTADDLKMTANEVKYVASILRTNVTMEGIDLSNTGLSPESLQEIAFALTVNSASNIVDINLSHNSLGERGISTLSAALLNLPRGLRRINLQSTGMTATFASKYLFKALFSNALHASTLQWLELGGFATSKRNFRRQPEAIENILIFLAIPNSLQELDISGGNMDLVKVIGSLQRGCLLKLTVLNMSGNSYTTENGVDPPEHWRKFFMDASSLEIICLSKTMLSASAFRNLLIGLSQNEKIEQSSKGISLDVSHNNLSTKGAEILIAIAQDLKNIHSLDVTNNGFERELKTVFESLMQNQCIRHFAIGQNFTFARQKPKDEALRALQSLMKSEQSVLESIDVSNSNLGSDTLKIIAALENCPKIKKIDLRGNNMGDVGAAQLAKVLHTNAALTWLSFDCNNITTKGLSAIANVLTRSTINREVAVPTEDIARAVKKDSLNANKPMATFLMATFVHRQPQRPDSIGMRRHHQPENVPSATKTLQQRHSQKEGCASIVKESPRSDLSEPQPNPDSSESSLANDPALPPQSVQPSINEIPRQPALAPDDTNERSNEQDVSHRLSQLDISQGGRDRDPASMETSRSLTTNIGPEENHRESVLSAHSIFKEVQDASSTGSF